MVIDTRRMPPGYGLLNIDDHVQWVLLASDGTDYTEEGLLTWSRMSARSGAWRHYRGD